MKNNGIGGCVVVFNPDDSVLENIKSYLPFLDYLVVVDNSTNKNDVCEKLYAIKNVHYIDMNGNAGIAAALNAGLDYLNERGCVYGLTMDQDSRFPLDDIEEILGILFGKGNEYALLGLNFNCEVKEKTDIIVEQQRIITSGNFVCLEAYREVGGFSEALFIDYVDFEFNERLQKQGRRIGMLRDYSLQHRIGNPIPFRLFGRTFYSMNHSALRYYYRYRNSCYLFLRRGRFYVKLFAKEVFWNIPKMLILEKNRLQKLVMIFRGLFDGIRGRLGRLDG